jgi:hypothetical protein
VDARAAQADPGVEILISGVGEMEQKYQLFQPIFQIKFREMSNSQAKAYLLWFREQIPIRIVELASYINSFPEYSNWEPNLHPSSLNSLGQWFFEQVQIRKRSQEEMNIIYASAVDWFRNNFEIQDWDLTKVTFSLSIDIGMYLGHIVEKENQNIIWRLGSKPRNNIYFQQPVLAGSGKVELNPVHVVTILAYGIANQNKGPERLRDLYDIWVNLLDG